MRIRVGVCDDVADVRFMVRVAIGREPDMDLVGEAVNGQEAIDLVRGQEIDVLILDLYMPEMDGLEALPSIK